MENQIRASIHAALSRLITASDVLWPGTDRQLPERNLSLYLAYEFFNRGYTTMTEWPLNRNEHIDLIAYHPVERILVLVESKRAWSRSLEFNWLAGDIERLEQAARGLDAWTMNATTEWESVNARAVFGVVLVGSTDQASLDPQKPRRGKVNDIVRTLISRVGKFDHVAHKDLRYPYVAHYAAWKIQEVTDESVN